MILLFGGTSETGPIARALVRAGYAVLVSTATTLALDLGTHAGIRRRCGRLDQAAMAELIRAEKIEVVVDAGHPYAVELHAQVQRAAAETGVCLVRFERPLADPVFDERVHRAADHGAAAALAVTLGRRILLTTGANNLAPYLETIPSATHAVFARVLPEPDSLLACRRAGLSSPQIVTGRGPFSIEANLAVLQSLKIDVLVTKESGAAGGLPEKLAAARRHACAAVVVARPVTTGREVCHAIDQLVHMVGCACRKSGEAGTTCASSVCGLA